MTASSNNKPGTVTAIPTCAGIDQNLSYTYLPPYRYGQIKQSPVCLAVAIRAHQTTVNQPTTVRAGYTILRANQLTHSLPSSQSVPDEGKQIINLSCTVAPIPKGHMNQSDICPVQFAFMPACDQTKQTAYM